MFKRTASSVLLGLLLLSLYTLPLHIQPVRALGTVYIMYDGSIDPPTAPISTTDNVTYIFTGNISRNIVIYRENIVLDGRGYTLNGWGSQTEAIRMDWMSNVTIKNTKIKGFRYGIWLYQSDHNKILGNCLEGWQGDIDDVGGGIGLDYSSIHNVVFGNNVTGFGYYGIYLAYGSICCNISENNLMSNYIGIGLNSMSDSSISGNSITNSSYAGIRLYQDWNNTVKGNNIINNNYGIDLMAGVHNDSVSQNSIMNNGFGIFASWDTSSSNNLFFHNNFINNVEQVHKDIAENFWDDGYPSGGNYWSDYSGVDLRSGPFQNETGSDGIGDTPYVCTPYVPRNQDNYPLMNPWPEQVIPVPFHYQSVDYWCGPACLEMVFDYYGEDISQLEIAEVARTHPYTTYTDELRRAAHFSNISTSKGTEMSEDITGYALRQLGYAAFEQGSMTIDQLKSLIDNDFPIILLMWYSPYHVSGHYRVAVGYNGTHIILHDPWNNVEWGGKYGGPYLAFNYSTFLDLWQYSGYWGLFTSPWNIEISSPSNVQEGDTFTVAANIAYPCPAPFPTSNYPSTLCNATITLPIGLVLAQGETSKKTLGDILPGDSVILNWTVRAENCGIYNLTVEAEGQIAGSVSAKGIFPSHNYEDRIGAKSNSIIEVSGHDLSIKNVILSKTLVGQGYNISMNVTTKSEGSFMENFNLTIYANETIIATIKNTTLSSGNSKIITITHNTTDLAKGNYTIGAMVDAISGETATFTDGWIIVTIPGDVDGDFDVDIYDIVKICGLYHYKIQIYPPPPPDITNCDIDGDGDIDIYDVVIACIHYGEKWP